MAKANSVIDTILGEAVSANRNARLEDMLGIASVIDNRSRLTAQTPQSVVSAPGQFNAYGKSLPKGTEAYRTLAQKAWDRVQKLGPINNATFYATPAAVNNLPGGLTQVASTAGHQYFADPQNRAIRTASGYVTPSSSIAGPLGPQSAARAMLSREAYGMAGAPDQSAIDKNLSPVSYNMGPNRPNKPSQDVVDTVRSAVRDTLGPGYSVSVTSGQEDDGKQYGSNRHKTGLAVDVQIADPTGRVMNAVEDQNALMDVAQAAAAKGIKGIGFGTGYMGGVAMHLDKFTPGTGQANQWGNIAKANASVLDEARAFSLMPSSFYDKNLPASMPAPPSRTETPAAFAAAPVGKVERMALAPAAPRAPDPARFAYDVTPPSQPSGFGIVSAAQAASMPPDPMTTAKVGRLAPAVSMPARPTTPTPATALQAMNKPAFAPAVSVPTSAITGLMAAVPTAAPQVFAPQPTALMPPAPVAPVAPPAPVSRISAPVSRPSMPSAPAATAADVYSGKAMSALDNTGKNTVSRDQFGNTSVTNQYGVTTKTSPQGFSSVSYGPAAPSAPSTPGAISGPLGAPGVSQSKGFLGIQPAKTETGNIARGVAGSMIGSALGSSLGPIGSLIGAALGNSIAKGKNPFDAFSGKTPEKSGMFTVNTYAGPMSFHTATPGLAFPDAPKAPAGFKSKSGVTDGMRGISPRAADAISKGGGGLY